MVGHCGATGVVDFNGSNRLKVYYWVDLDILAYKDYN